MVRSNDPQFVDYIKSVKAGGSYLLPKSVLNRLEIKNGNVTSEDENALIEAKSAFQFILDKRQT